MEWTEFRKNTYMTKEEFISKFKEGDVLISRNWMFIYASLRTSNFGVEVRNAIVYHALYNTRNHDITIETRTGIGYIEGIDFRFANNKEKKALYDVLAGRKYKWNPELNRLEYNGRRIVVDDQEFPF
jgi:hypothetical protein